MRDWMRRRAVAATGVVAGMALAALVAGCGSDSVAPSDGSGPGPGPETRPFELTQLFLRPLAIERPPLAGGRPTPSLAEYALTCFYDGGTQLATFDWVVPASIGTVEPKTVYLNRADATVVIRGDGKPPLGFFEVEARGRSGQETGTLAQRFAVVENRWMKHVRRVFTGTEPEDLAQYPTFVSGPGRAAAADTILYVHDSGTTRTILRFPAFANLNVLEPGVSDVMVAPLFPNGGTQSQNAPQTQPDAAPGGLGRRELLFSSSMDPQYLLRCPREPCENVPPFRLWVERIPAGAPLTPHMLTADTTYIGAGGQPRWIAFQYMMPKWDPSATGTVARIAFLSDLSGNPTAARIMNLWFGDLVDLDGDAHSDTLTNLRQITTHGGISGYSWQSDGTRICLADGQGLAWLDTGSGALTRIELPNEQLIRPAYPTVYWKPGEHTLVAFQAQAENLRNIFVWDEQDNTLTQVLPNPVPVSHNLFPRWHPYRKALIYISDYTVRAWASQPDRINPSLDPYQSVSRTMYPSPWVLSLE